MKKMNKTFSHYFLALPIIVSALAYQSTAQAEIGLTGTYTGIYFSNSSIEETTSSGNTSAGSWGHIKGKLGYTLTDWIAIEGQLGMITNTSADDGLLTYGGYMRVGKDLGQYKPYGLLGGSGYYWYEDGYEDQAEAGVSFGFGVDVFGSKDKAITFEYLRLMNIDINGDNLIFDTIGVGFTYYFSDEQSQFVKNRNKIRSIRY